MGGVKNMEELKERSTHSQCMKILKHLREVGSITSMEALNLYGVARLASRICDLKKMKYKIDKQMIKVLTRTNEIARVAQYSLVEE